MLALCCLLLAAVTAIGAHRSGADGPSHPVVVAARDVAAGAVLTARDVRVKSWPDDLRPVGALTRAADVIGRHVGAAVRAGEPLTAARLVGAALTSGLAANLRAVPVEVSGTGFVQAGDAVDLLVSDPPDAAATGPPVAHLLAQNARVLAVTSTSSADSSAGGDPDTVGIVVAVDQGTALRIAAASGRALLATLRNPP